MFSIRYVVEIPRKEAPQLGHLLDEGDKLVDTHHRGWGNWKMPDLRAVASTDSIISVDPLQMKWFGYINWVSRGDL